MVDISKVDADLYASKFLGNLPSEEDLAFYSEMTTLIAGIVQKEAIPEIKTADDIKAALKATINALEPLDANEAAWRLSVVKRYFKGLVPVPKQGTSFGQGGFTISPIKQNRNDKAIDFIDHIVRVMPEVAAVMPKDEKRAGTAR